MPMGQETESVVSLVGTKDNPAREARKRPSTGKGSIGDVALRDGITLVIAAWVVVLFLYFSLRNHNV